jgi:hypothetical protein
MTFLEKDLESIIYDATFEQLLDKGLWLAGKKHRQLKIGNYGITDIVSIQRPYYHPHFEKLLKGTITILELKKDKIGMHTFDQLIRYAIGVKLYLEKRKLLTNYNISLVAIGKEIDLTSSFCYLSDLFNQDISETFLDYSEPIINFSALTYSYNFDGINFSEVNGYTLKNNGF